ncbi:class A beta-lactamase, subclass A2 [Sphingobacterium faecium]|uniref:class A beta-lactamase, subclass A2 n=1 Tax=Sphingobacterium faecium TaxID=34087 RepID=UPI0024686FCF|nr:class A beta-lactamase, subclass A2 [Sphingobacterium faecium]MDH5826879.1 class A beta-lactamase, subclass A2 [Sphingobacterium faecium]
MLKLIKLTLILLLFSLQIHAQSMDSLRTNLEKIVQSKDALIGIAITGIDKQDTLGVNADHHLPMQSVFKVPIAIVMLSEIDKGNFELDQEIKITKKDMTPEIWSPIREKYPKGVTLTIREILEYTLTLSDNIGCDVILKLLGGPQVVERYFTNMGFSDISIKINEKTMQSDWESQFRNWATPREINKILQTFYVNEKNLLSLEQYDFLWSTMISTNTGLNQLKGQLPKHTVVAHKTGSSGTHKKTGITAALNDVGVILLPNGEYFVISVFVTNSKENQETNEKIIADIAKQAWDYFVNKGN